MQAVAARILAGLTGLGILFVAALAADPTSPAAPGLRTFVPDSVSPAARAIFEKFAPGAAAAMAHFPSLKTNADIEALHDKMEALQLPGAAKAVKALSVSSVMGKLGGVGVLTTLPPNYVDDGTVLIRVHGGGWILGSAQSTAGADAQMAILTGKRIVSVDYTVAPRGNFQTVTDQVVAVYKAVMAQGYKPQNIGIFGESAGANIVPGAMLKARDQGLPMPAAMLLMSPCTDLHLNGDTETTLRLADPVLDIAPIGPGLNAYAAPQDWSNPYASPVYGDYSKPYPPTLIQVGTKELLLSDSVRLYQAMKAGGRDVVLDVYEGMPHVFQGYMTGTPEQKAAFAEINRFWKAHLAGEKR